MGIGNSDLGKLNSNELEILRKSWAVIMENIDETGPYIFGSFLRKYNYSPYFAKFSKVPADKIYDSVVFKEHSFLVLNTINKVVLDSSDNNKLKSDLLEIGKTHVKKKITAQQFLELKNLIVDILDKKYRLPSETLKIWNKGFDISYFYVFQALEPNQGSTSLDDGDLASTAGKNIKK